MVTWGKFQTEGPQTSVATVKNLVAMATCRPGFVHPPVFRDIRLFAYNMAYYS
jgi:hypothetical protein